MSINKYTLLLLLGFFLQACSGTEGSGGGTTGGLEPTLSSIQVNIFTPKCLICHTPGGEGYVQTEPSPLDLSTKEASFSGLVGVESVQERCGTSADQPCGLRVLAGDPDSSYLIDKLNGGGLSFATAQLPRKAEALTEEEIDAIRQWIQDGALDN